MLISQKQYNIETYFKWKTNRKSYVAYEMASMLVASDDLEHHPPFAGLFKCNQSNICAAFYKISTGNVLVWSIADIWASCFRTDVLSAIQIYDYSHS